MATDKKPNTVEVFKSQSNYLAGDIAAEHVDGTDHFGKGSVQLLKHHGTYQQDNRDDRGKKRQPGVGKSYMFMVRTRIPGGKLTSEQLLAELDLCDEVGGATLRITSRQGLQLHGVLKRDLQKTLQRINQVQLTTLGACGDVERNVMCCPAPHEDDPVHQQMQEMAEAIAHHFRIRSSAYYEIWLQDMQTGEKELCASGPGEEGVEPIYGTSYLPRKFKTAIGLPGDNCVDLYTHDLGLMAICHDWNVVGYNVLVGGGQGVTPAAKKTFPALAKRMAFVRPEQVIDVATAIVKVQRDHGNRVDRKVARLKYLIADWGLEKFKSKVEEYYGQPLEPPRPDEVHGFDDHMGWRDQGHGKVFYGLNVENGRIKDEGEFRLKSALRIICRRFAPGIRLTSHQSLLLTDLAPEHRGEIEKIFRDHGVPLSEEISNARRWSMACVAWPTCGLSITESERALPGMIDQLEVEIAKLGLCAEEFTIRMTGCPNGCARPYNSDVGIVGRAAGKYTLFLGGRLVGNRLNTLFKDHVPTEEVVPTLAAVLAHFKAEREEDESLGDFCHRLGNEALLAWCEQHVATTTGP